MIFPALKNKQSKVYLHRLGLQNTGKPNSIGGFGLATFRPKNKETFAFTVSVINLNFKIIYE